MTSTVLILLASVLWLFMCLRFWTMISRENIWQRRLIAIAGGLGAGMIYFLGTMVWRIINLPPPEEARPVEEAADIRVAPRLPAREK
jgi:hypothetical protein